MTDPSRRPTPRNLFSFSRLKCFHQCPRYRYHYLKGLREAFRSVESFLGSTVHDVLEWLYRERRQGASPALPAALERFAAQWEIGWSDDVAVVRVADDREPYHRAGREMVERYWRGPFQLDRSETVALERRVSLPLGDELVFTGFVDRVGRTEAGRLFVVDYKTSRSQGDGGDFSEGLQAPLYTACLLEHDDHRQDADALAGYHYLRHGTTSWQQVSRQRASDVVERFRLMTLEAVAAAEFPARPGVLCAWCGFNAVCPEARVPDGLAGGLRLARERSGSPLFD